MGKNESNLIRDFDQTPIVNYANIRTLARAYKDATAAQVSAGNRLGRAVINSDCQTEEEWQLIADVKGCTIEEAKQAVVGDMRDQAHEDYKKLLETLRGNGRLLDRIRSGALTTNDAQFLRSKSDSLPNGRLNTLVVLSAAARYHNAVNAQKTCASFLEAAMVDIPIYKWLKAQRGIDSVTAGKLIGTIDIYKARKVSQIWSYAGYDVVNGEGRSRKKHHLVEVQYTDKNGNQATRMGLSHNPDLKQDLYVLATNFIRSKHPKYSKVFYDYRERLENNPKHAEKTKLQRRNMAYRYMVKIFLLDLYLKWRELEGLPITAPYSEDKLGRPPHGE